MNRTQIHLRQRGRRFTVTLRAVVSAIQPYSGIRETFAKGSYYFYFGAFNTELQYTMCCSLC